MSTALFCPAEFRPAPSTMASFADNSQFPWMAVALGEAGVAENTHPGRRNERVMEYLHCVNRSISDDETPWCAGFVNWVMREVGIAGTGRLNARSFLTWGASVPTTSPHYGAVAVLWRVSPQSAKGHVAFFCGMEGDNMILLGGNQGNRVQLSPYPYARLLSFRWPPHFPPPNQSVPM